MQSDAWFFVGIFAFIFLIWIATGGPLHPLSFGGPTLAQPEELGGGSYLSLPRAPYAIGMSRSSLPRSSSDTSSNDSDEGVYRTSRDLFGIAFGNPSPYRDAVTMRSSVSGASSTSATKEYVQLTASRNTAPVPITGWKLVSETSGNAAVIPRGSELPVAGRINPVEPIVLAPGDRAYVSSGGSPIGISFRENKCTGYFAQYQNITPTLQKRCPDPSADLKTLYGPYYIRDTACIEFVDDVARCQAVIYTPRHLSAACKNFVRTYLNYNGCVAGHQGDSDFHSTTWRIYLGYNDPLWRARNEVIKLFDLNSKTVSAISY